MPFASKDTATDSKGKIKKGYKEVTDKNGKVRYMTETPPKSGLKVTKDKKGVIKVSKVEQKAPAKKTAPKESKESKESKASKASKTPKKKVEKKEQAEEVEKVDFSVQP